MGLLHPFGDNILPYLKRYGSRVTACGIRYGSVIYLGFGVGVRKTITRTIMAMTYPVEIEFGADEWTLSENTKDVVTSRFRRPERAREELEQYLVGRTVAAIEITPT